MSKPIIQIDNLSVRFPVFGGVFLGKVAEVRAVDGITFDLMEGETLGLVGESGCGKTTVGRAIINILRFIAPDVIVGGNVLFHTGDSTSPVDITRLKKKEMRPYRSMVQMIFQDPFASLNPRLTVAKIVEEPLLIHTAMTTKERQDRIGWLLEKVGLNPEQSQRYPHEFSGGQRQRIGIARALATNPKVIIADEPVSALDVSIQAQVINLLQDLQDEFGLTFLFIAHDLSVVEHISQRIAVMYLGNLVEIGPSDIVYGDPKHPYTKALLSAIPLPDPKNAEKRERIILKGDIPTPMGKPSGCPFRTRCPIAKDSCAEQMPPLKSHGDGRLFACPWA
ncbi:MAG: ATP-binding cassette domain-containing protein [Candidatus Electryoneaceae bacterium]|nr:ATP-binding cassette domain-containing protein [Candidatus Electryoneaceae bacterium]